MFSGSLVAIVTPMHSDGAIDFAAWDRVLDLHLANGTAGIVVCGTTGESPTVSEAEQHELLRRAQPRLAGRMALLAGVGGSSTADVVERTRRLATLTLDGVLAVTPAYNRPTQEGLYQHFAAIAAVATAPVMLYNVPARTAVDMLPATVVRLAKLAGIVAVKEAVGTIERIRELCAIVPQGFDVLSGDDATARDSVLAGACGVVSVTANVAPRAMAAMIAAARAGDAVAASRHDAPLTRLHQALFVEANPIPVKWALADMGLIGDGIRLPLTWLAEQHRARLRGAVNEALGSNEHLQAGAA